MELLILLLLLWIMASLGDLLKRRGISYIVFELNRGLGNSITVSISVISTYNVQLSTTVIIKLIVTKIAYNGFITLIITFITSIITITIITAYIIALSLRNISINIITVLINIVINTNVVFIKAVFNTIINNNFINYTKELYVDNNYSI